MRMNMKNKNIRDHDLEEKLREVEEEEAKKNLVEFIRVRKRGDIDFQTIKIDNKQL
jgi:hypothetical protein